MMDNGWIKLYRSLTEWEWYDNIPTKTLWLHLLLTCNWQDAKWHGQTIKAGQRVTSIGHLARETGLSERSVRTALEHLKSTGEVTTKSTNKYTVVSLENWGKFNTDDLMTDKQADNLPTINRQSTDKQPTTNKEIKESKKKKNIYSDLPSDLVDSLKDFAEMRKKMKKPLTEKALELQVGKLKKMADINSPQAIAIVNQSIERGWLSFYELKEDAEVKVSNEQIRKNNESAIRELKQKLAVLKDDLAKALEEFSKEKNDANYKRVTQLRTDIGQLEERIARGEKK